MAFLMSTEPVQADRESSGSVLEPWSARPLLNLATEHGLSTGGKHAVTVTFGYDPCNTSTSRYSSTASLSEAYRVGSTAHGPVHWLGK